MKRIPVIQTTPSPASRACGRAGVAQVLAALLLLASGISPARAATIVVNSTNDPAGFNPNITIAQLGATVTLRDAVNAAVNTGGDNLITFDASLAGQTIGLSLIGDNSVGPSALPVAGNVTIDAGSGGITLARSGPAQLRHFYVTSIGSLTLTNVELSGGSVFEGGAIYNHGSVTAIGGAFKFNDSISRGRGGAIFNTGTAVFAATGTTFQGNRAEGVGGAIYNESTNTTPVSVANSSFIVNYSIGYVVGGNTFRSDGHGGAIYNAGRFALKRSYLGGNQANYNGGAIYNTGSGNMTVGDSFFELNAPTSFSIGPFYGGAIRNDGALLVSGTTFLSNSANNRGGAVFAAGGTTIVNSTFSQNAANFGAAVTGGSGAAVGIHNCTAAQNSGFYTLWSEQGANLTVNNSILFNTSTSLEFGSFNGSFTTANNIVRGSNPDPQLLPFGRYGGPFVGPNGFESFLYGIPATSPAVNAGDYTKLPINPSTGLPFATDQRGAPRITNGALDIGAYETDSVPAASEILPASGSYSGGVTVTLNTTNTGATLRYTTDGSTPTDTHGDTYTGPFTLWTSTTVKAIATGGGWLTSPMATETYTVQTGLQAWRALHDLPADGSQDTANPSGDGVANLLKFAFNLAPDAGDLLASNRTVMPPGGSAGLPHITVDATPRLVFEFVRRKAASNPGIGYVVETGPDLSAWTPLDLSGATVESIDPTWERVTITDPVSSATRFGRIQVVRFDPYANNFDAGLGTATLRGTAVWTNQAVMLTDIIGGQIGAVVFDGVSAGPANNGFTARFSMNLGPAGQPAPADGLCFAVGDLGTAPWGESGPGTARHLAVGFDTWNNGGTGDIGIHLWTNGTHVASNPINPFTDGVTVPVEISYDASSGVTVKFNGATVLSNVALPGFSLPSGSRFGMGARTGGAVERAVVDEVVITPR